MPTNGTQFETAGLIKTIANLAMTRELSGIYIHSHLQDFVRNQREVALVCSSRLCEMLQLNADKLRLIVGLWQSDAELRRRGKRDAPAPPEPDIHAPPRLSLLELVRAQVQIFINLESAMNHKSVFSKRLDDKDASNFAAFLDHSRYFSDILRLNGTLSVLCDESALFFEEYFLNLLRSSKEICYFPGTTSLPYILVSSQETTNASEFHTSQCKGAFHVSVAIYANE
jgi:hypothetical protein